MSYIVKLLKKEYLNEIKTTKDLIYKDKIINPHNIAASYEMIFKNGEKDFWKNKIKYGNNYYFYNHTIDIVFKMSLLNAKLTKSMSKVKSLSNFIYSEIQNSMWIEGVRSSKKQIKQFLKPEILDSNDNNYLKKMIMNYKFALDHVLNNSESINETSLFVLYKLLTKNIDLKENALDGNFYREDEVEIGNSDIKGISPSLIKVSMDKLFDFIKAQNSIKPETIKNEKAVSHFHYLNAILIHLNFEHIHPYYDMNGRMGRILSVWYLSRYNLVSHMLYMSEAINMFKNELYYKAFKKIRINDFKFDATYFVGSFMTCIIAHKVCFLVMKNIENQIKKSFKSKFNSLEKEIVMNLLSKSRGAFYKKEELILGVEYINVAQISKSFKKLVDWKIINEVNSKPKEYSLIWTKKITNLMQRLIIVEKGKN